MKGIVLLALLATTELLPSPDFLLFWVLNLLYIVTGSAKRNKQG